MQGHLALFESNVYDIFLKGDIFSPQTREILNEVNETRLDYLPLHSRKSQFIKPIIAVVGSGEVTEDFLRELVESKQNPAFKYFAELEIFNVLPQSFVGLNGNFGNFQLLYTESGVQKPLVLEVSQVVFFTKFESVASIKGVHWVSGYANADALINALHGNCGVYSYEAPIVFNPNLCDFQHRRAKNDGSGYCLACVNTCATRGIFSNIKKMEILLSPVDCVACGECVSVCPTGALVRESESLLSLTFQARVCKGFSLIVHTESSSTQVLRALAKSTNKSVLPFVMGQPHILNETYLLSLVQESASMLILYGELNAHVSESVRAVNALSQAIFGKSCILLANNESELDSALLQADSLEQAHYIYTPRENEGLKEIFSQRAFAWVRGNDFGRIHMPKSGNVLIDSQGCTLCLSCVEACKTKALINNTSSFELLFKQSLCTGCNYCADACAEKVIKIESNVLDVKASSFAYELKAQDEPFKCVECGKIFATSKSISKIKELLSSAFAGDFMKQKSIECCADCKVKIIFAPKEHS